MVALNLEAKNKEQELIKAYLEENASEILAAKINNGTKFEKDCKHLINHKTLDGFLNYACEEAKKHASKGAKGACIEDQTVFGWAVHYFKEDSIEGTLYNEDGTEYKPQPKKSASPAPKAKTNTPIAAKKPAEQLTQLSLFDLDTEVQRPIEESKELLAPNVPESSKTVTDDPEPPQEDPTYRRCKEISDKYPDTIVLYRSGDFYEAFGDNAVTLANALELTLTGRDFGLSERVPTVGFPYHATDLYISKLIALDYRVTLVDTLGDPVCLPAANNDEYVDPETGEVLTEAEMQKFDGDIEEIVQDDPNVKEDTKSELSDLFGDLFLVR